jgi:hypothetical protein
MNAFDGKEAKAGKRSGNYGMCKGKCLNANHTRKNEKSYQLKNPISKFQGVYYACIER